MSYILVYYVMLVGSWGFSSNKGVFAATSIENRKVLDVECRNILKAACKKRNDFQKKDPSAYAQWQNLQICKINDNCTARRMEAKGAKRVFLRSTLFFISINSISIPSLKKP